ncbi:Na+/H+ antiporter subunit A [Paenibacillus sp. 598K]|uniref:Na+/H+ antiporter subunit A n=1 Tax=Paenibacillus sp. 598K TaxID=1117987 RepID=UPI000FF9DA7E|nr:Na+/H+ antiporter subunit A [Paenibacillus sp. 598K]GBF76889.1 Na+/H+ antiporter subunit A [Paenibacillus sp. 598K]
MLHGAILSPFLLALLLPLLFRWTRGRQVGWAVLLAPVALFVYFASFLPQIGRGETILRTLPWVPSLGISFDAYVDGLGLLFALLITGVGALVVLYAIFYLDRRKEQLHHFYFYLLLFMGAMLGIVLSDNLILLYVFWELTSLSSSLLVAFWYDRDRSVYGARKSMLITVFGGFAMLAGFILLYLEGGTFSIQGLIAQADSLFGSPLFYAAMALVLLGAFTKSAQFPFHIWLPDAMEAPTPVSAYLHSATMVKAGVYLVARMMPIFGGSEVWLWALLLTGLVTMCWGSVSAIRQHDLKGILAFSTISQLGLLMLLLGIGSAAMLAGGTAMERVYAAAVTTALVHLVNHATFKGSLFMIVGIIDHETGTRDIRRLGGLMTVMPIAFTVALFGLSAMAGLPPFNGFISKEMFFTALISLQELPGGAAWLWVAVIGWLASIFTFGYCALMLGRTFTGKFKPHNFDQEVHEAPIGLLISPIVLGSLVLLLGLFPNLLVPGLIEPAVASILPTLDPTLYSFRLSMWHGPSLELGMSLGVVILGLLLYRSMPRMAGWGWFGRERDPLNRLYDGGLDALAVGSERITGIQMTGRLRDYLVYMLLFIIGLVTYVFYRSGSFTLPTAITGEAPVYVYGVSLLLIAATFALLQIKERIAFIVALGVIGLMVSLLFTIFSAQDLALTQLLVETVTVILLLLAFRRLPEMTSERIPPFSRMVKLIVSTVVGVGVFLLGVSAYSYRTETGLPSISDFFKANTYELGGGQNMVNVILVDFRALDTLLEVLVLGIVGLGIMMLVKHRFKGGEDV